MPVDVGDLLACLHVPRHADGNEEQRKGYSLVMGDDQLSWQARTEAPTLDVEPLTVVVAWCTG